MEIDRDRAIKLLIVVIGTLAALAVMSTIVQLIQTVLPFLIVAAGAYLGYRWALSDSAAPTADEVEEQARGWFSRFRRTSKAVETTMKAGAALNELQNAPESAASQQPKRSRRSRRRSKAEAKAAEITSPEADSAADEAAQEAAVAELKQSLAGEKKGAIEFKDSDVVISQDDLVLPDISRLEEKENEPPQINNDVLSQIEERRRRLHGES